MKTISRLTTHYCLRKQMKALRPQLYRLAWSWCHDAEQADDLVQDTLLRGLERIDQLRDQEQLKYWLCRIMSNLHKDQLRMRRESVNYEEVVLPAEGDPEQEAGRQELIGQVRTAIAKLNEDQRMVVTLVDLMGFSYADVAGVLEVPVGTVMSRLNRARERMRSLLMRQHREYQPPAAVGYLRRVK